jgi:hypothetical protein
MQEDGNDNIEGVWILLEDGRLEFRRKDSWRDAGDRQRVRLDTSVAVAHIMPEIDIIPAPVVDRSAVPGKAWAWNRLWVAEPSSKKVSWFQALMILLKHRSVRHDEIAELLRDAESLILTGHAGLAITRLSDWMEHAPGLAKQAMGMLSLAYFMDHQPFLARAAHVRALELGCPHPAMIDRFGLDLEDGLEDSLDH